MGAKSLKSIFAVFLVVILFLLSGCSPSAPSADSDESQANSSRTHVDTDTPANEYILAASQGSSWDAVTSVLYNDTEAYFIYNEILYRYMDNEAAPVLGTDTVYNIAGIREDGLYLIVKDSSVSQFTDVQYSWMPQASLDLYEPNTQKSKRIITGIQGAVLAGEDNELLLYYLFDPADTEYGYRLKAYMRNLQTGKEQEIFADEYIVTDVYVEEEEVSEPAFDCHFHYEDNRITLSLSYPYPSEYPYMRTVMLGMNGVVLEDSEGLLAPAPPASDLSSSSWLQDFSLDCGGYVVYAEKGEEEYGVTYITDKNGNRVIIDSNVFWGQAATNNEGLFFYSKSNSYSNNARIMVYNGEVPVPISYPQQGRLPYSKILQFDDNVYLLFYDDQYAKSVEESPNENRVAIYQAIGTLDNPSKLQLVFPLPGDEAMFTSAGEWYHGIKYYQAGKLLLVDGQYPSSLLLFNLESHEYIVIND